MWDTPKGVPAGGDIVEKLDETLCGHSYLEEFLRLLEHVMSILYSR
jgi:hypothetical protein